MPKDTDDEFLDNLEKLFEATGITKRTAFADFLGITYMTYCNWRNNNSVASLNFHNYAIEAYLKLPAHELKALVRERIAE